MRIVCSWCRREGKVAVIGEKAPLDDLRETHGICGPHQVEVQLRWRAETAWLGTSSSMAPVEAPLRRGASWRATLESWQAWLKSGPKGDRRS